jgi:serine protease inhibitor
VRRVGILLVMVLGLASCAPSQPAPPAQPIEPIALVEELDPGTAEWLAGATNEFGFDVLDELADGDNVVISPLSIAAVLTMILNGAAGETAEAIAGTLHLSERAEAEINSAYASLLALLQDSGEVELAVANSLWANSGTSLVDDYVSRVGEAFAAEIDEVDLGSSATAESIDEWVQQKTRDLIEEIAGDLGLPDPDALLVLLNAVYFKGDWTEPFNPGFTQDGEFTRPDGSTVTVPMMTRSDDVLYARGSDFAMVRLPYGDDERFAMEIVVPDGPLDEFHFDAARWADATGALSEQWRLLALPRFELEYSTDGALNDALVALGMGIAYSSESDFTRMSPADPWLSTVVHKTYIRVDEEGTEAAAVTGGVMATSAPPEFRVDRPFLFTISDTDTGSILFLGAVTDPSA